MNTVEQTPERDTRYERRAIALLALGFGLVGLDRWIIAPLFPSMMQDLKLGYADLGGILGILGITWGVASTLMGSVSDRYGRRVVLIPSLLLFSALSVFSGVATGAAGLLLIRGIMGVSEGAYLSSSVAAAGEASAPSRRGMNQGLMLSAFPMFGLALAPIVATQLLAVVPSWRWVFFIVAIPGFVVAALMWRVVREPAHLRRGAVSTPPVRWLDVLRSRNVLLAMFSLVCAMSCVFVLAGMVPNYLQDYLKLGTQQMGLVMSGLGLGGFAGEWLVCAVSDRLGRRLMSIVSFAGAMASLYLFMHTGADPWTLFLRLFLASFFSFGILGLMTGPVATEGVPTGLIASAVGIVSGAGEVVGGGLVPVIVGYIAQSRGIQNIFYVSLTGVALGLVASAFLVETAPRVRAAAMRASVQQPQS